MSSSSVPDSGGFGGVRRGSMTISQTPPPPAGWPRARSLRSVTSPGGCCWCAAVTPATGNCPAGTSIRGESASGAAVQETAEESGITVQVTGLAGIYTDPGHVIADPRTGLVRQPFAVCFHARLLSGSPGGNQVETSDARWFTAGDIPALPIRSAMRLRIGHALSRGRPCHIG